MEKQKKENLIYKGRIITLYNDEVVCSNGRMAKREYVHHNGGAAVLAVKNDEILLIKQFRYPYHKDIYEIPAGKIEIGEDPYQTALRELEEECGYKASTLIDLGSLYPTCGYSDEVIYLYLAKDYEKTSTHFDEDEEIEAEFLKIEDALKMIKDGNIKDSKTIIAILKYANNLY